MILSTERKFIFIHVPKAVGTSIHGALAHEDVFHKVRRAGAGERKHCTLDNKLPAEVAGFSQHTSAKGAIKVLGRAAFDSYYSFCFVRHPWDVDISWFHYRLQVPKIEGHADAASAGTFEANVRRVPAGPDGARWVGLQHPYVVDDDMQIAVRFVGRYESLTQDLASVIAVINLEPLPLDRFNESYHAPWSSLYTRETFAVVARHAARDAQLFGYSSNPAAYGIR